MVLPLRDSPGIRHRPWVTYVIIALNLIIFLVEAASPDLSIRMANLFGVIPREAIDPSQWVATGGWPLITLFTATFLHGSWGHVLGNMLYLGVFGDNVEDRLGPGRYLAFYLACGLLANIAHILANPTSDMPTIGASGAVAGVLGGYILAYPRARVLTLIPLGFLVPAIKVPAWAYLGLWFFIQLASGLAPLWVRDMTQTVAFWAHISGFLCGIALMQLLQPKSQQPLPEPR